MKEEKMPEAVPDRRDPRFVQLVESILKQSGKKKLDDKEIAILACDEIARSYTHEEKQYTA